MNRGLLATTLAVVIVAAFSGGCASEATLDLNARLTSLERVSKKPADAAYLVDCPDTIKVEVLNEPSATRDVTLRSDGCVTLLYLEDVKVGRMTTLQIREMLEKAYEKFYKEPKILVTVTAYRSKRVYVYGEVGRQGTYPYTGSQTVASIIGDAGGVTPRAAWGRVKVIRGDPKNPDIFPVDLNRLILDGDTSQDVSLAENDVIRVPPDALAWFGYQVDAVFFPFRDLFGAVQTGQMIGVVRTPIVSP